MVKEIRTTYKIIVFDTNKPSGIIPSDSVHLIYCDIERKNSWGELIPELTDKWHTLINNE
jgi:hypothetical protein